MDTTGGKVYTYKGKLALLKSAENRHFLKQYFDKSFSCLQNLLVIQVSGFDRKTSGSATLFRGPGEFCDPVQFRKIVCSIEHNVHRTLTTFVLFSEKDVHLI
jgi:hypothetical protein